MVKNIRLVKSGENYLFSKTGSYTFSACALSTTYCKRGYLAHWNLAWWITEVKLFPAKRTRARRAVHSDKNHHSNKGLYTLKVWREWNVNRHLLRFSTYRWLWSFHVSHPVVYIDCSIYGEGSLKKCSETNREFANTQSRAFRGR